MIKNIYLTVSVLLIAGCNNYSETDYASQKEKNIQLKIKFSECTLSINDLKMLDIQKDEIRSNENFNELDYEDLKVENSQLAISLKECESKVKEREVIKKEKERIRAAVEEKEKVRSREKEIERARAEAKKKEKAHAEVKEWKLRQKAQIEVNGKSNVSCRDAAHTVLSHYKKALLYLKDGMRQKADTVFQVSLREKDTFMLVCKNTEYATVFQNVKNTENILFKNSIYINANKLQDIAKKNIQMLSERQRILENDIQRENERHKRKMESIARERKQKMDEYNRKIKELERL